MDIKKQVNSIVKKYGTRNPFEIINNLNAILVRTQLVGVHGFYQYFQRNNIIYIDESLPENEQLFVCAHELGHLFLHKQANAFFMDTKTYFNGSRYENEANAFAAELLIPDELILENPHYSKQQIAKLAGYTEKLMDFKTI